MSLVATACDDGTAPGYGPPGISVISRGAPSDSIGAQQQLVIAVHGPDGRAARGVAVQFQAATSGVSIWVARVAPNFLASVIDTTDGAGRAAVDVRLGGTVGTGRIIVTVPSMALIDTIFYEITPGAPVRLIVDPVDTAVYLGRTLTPRARVVDHGGNALSNPVTLSSLSPVLTTSVDGVITGVAAGRGGYIARSGSMTDTGWVSVIPVMGMIAVTSPALYYSDRDAVAILNLDGSDFRLLPGAPHDPPTGGGLVPRWHPNGTRLYYHTAFPLTSKRLYTVDLTGAARIFLGAFENEEFADVSADGAWVYFVVQKRTEPATIWRVRSDGTSPEAIASAQPRTTDLYPAISPDGAWLAYTAYAPPRIRVRDVATGVRTPLDVPGKAPRWSPSGDLIAYIGGEHGGLLRVVRADGSGDRAVSSIPYDGTLTWSPDGRYLIAQSIPNYAGRPDYTGGLELVEVSSGDRIILPFPTLSYPDWRPATP